MESTTEGAAPHQPVIIESGMRSGQGDEDDATEAMTIGEKYDDEVPDAGDSATDLEQVENAAAAPGTPTEEIPEVVSDITERTPDDSGAAST